MKTYSITVRPIDGPCGFDFEVLTYGNYNPMLIGDPEQGSYAAHKAIKRLGFNPEDFYATPFDCRRIR